MTPQELIENCTYPKCMCKGLPFDINPKTDKPYLCPCNRHLLDKEIKNEFRKRLDKDGLKRRLNAYT